MASIDLIVVISARKAKSRAQLKLCAPLRPIGELYKHCFMLDYYLIANALFGLYRPRKDAELPGLEKVENLICAQLA
jgi:hypothetical protein